MLRLPISSLFAALLSIMLVFLSLIVIVTRMKTKIDLGDGDNAQLIRRIRAHGNFVEYAPIGLIVLGLTEASGAGATWLWTLGTLLLAGRILHATGMIVVIQPLRVAGTMLTNWSLLLGAALLFMMWRASPG